MKLRKTENTKVKIPNSKPVKYKLRPTSYHEISIPDTYIEKCRWEKNDTLSCQAVKMGDDNVLIIRNVDRQAMTMDFMTMAK
jgi:hypothetical protein